jgi:uncharacterized protein (TIGR02996 family)
MAKARGSSTLDALWAAVRAAPGDAPAKLVLADYLEEHGDANAGFALRWCAREAKWPRLTKTQASWYTDPSRRHPGDRAEVERATLPLAFFVVGHDCQRCVELAGMPSRVTFGSLPEALAYLGAILANLRWSVEASGAPTTALQASGAPTAWRRSLEETWRRLRKEGAVVPRGKPFIPARMPHPSD